MKQKLTSYERHFVPINLIVMLHLRLVEHPFSITNFL